MGSAGQEITFGGLRLASRLRSSLKKRKDGKSTLRRLLFLGTLAIIVWSSAHQTGFGSAPFAIEVIAIAALIAQILLAISRGIAKAKTWSGGNLPWSKKEVAAPLGPPQAHDLARVVGNNGPSLDSRGFHQNMRIAIGRGLGVKGDNFWTPHALIIGASGSGKTKMLRPFVGRWLASGPSALFSTKGDIIPPPPPTTSAVVHLVTPKGRAKLDLDGQQRLITLEQAGWTIVDTRWDPVIWVSQAETEDELQSRATTVARTLAGVIGASGQNTNMWTTSATDLITAAIITECATIKGGFSSWLALIDPTDLASGSDALLNTAVSDSHYEPGIERLVWELKQLPDLPTDIDPSGKLSESEIRASHDIRTMARRLKQGNPTASSTFQTATTALAAYNYPAAFSQTPVYLSNWASSEHDLLVVIVPSSQSQTWVAPMAALAVAIWTESSEKSWRNHLLVLDEVASLAPVPRLQDWVAQGRSLGVHVIAVLQNEGQAQVWAQNNTTSWILSWPLALVASGSPSTGLAKHLAEGEGQWEVEKKSTTLTPGQGFFAQPTKTYSVSKEMRDRIEPNDVFSVGMQDVWRVVDQKVGPWAAPIW